MPRSRSRKELERAIGGGPGVSRESKTAAAQAHLRRQKELGAGTAPIPGVSIVGRVGSKAIRRAGDVVARQTILKAPTQKLGTAVAEGVSKRAGKSVRKVLSDIPETVREAKTTAKVESRVTQGRTKTFIRQATAGEVGRGKATLKAARQDRTAAGMVKTALSRGDEVFVKTKSGVKPVKPRKRR